MSQTQSAIPEFERPTQSQSKIIYFIRLLDDSLSTIDQMAYSKTENGVVLCR